MVLISASLFFFIAQFQSNVERSQLYAQMNYAMEDVKMRCPSAIDLGSYFDVRFPSGGNKDTKDKLIFWGEKDQANVTPDDKSDNLWYKYYINPSGDFVIKECVNSSCNAGSEDILIDKDFQPKIEFIYEKDSAPNFLKVLLTAQNKKPALGSQAQIVKEAGLRFWFIDIAK
jgi:hypothetical protein